MSLSTLRRHRHLPAVVALMSVLLYASLVTSHIVSQATQATTQLDAAGHSIAVGDPDCHNALPSAGNDPSRSLPAAPAKKCPFCTAYASLHITVVGGGVYVLLGEVSSLHVGGLNSAQLISAANLPSWHPRAPPALG
jgi:hypothetical protein